MEKRAVILVSVIVLLGIFFIFKTRMSNEELTFIDSGMTGHAVYEKEPIIDNNELLQNPVIEELSYSPEKEEYKIEIISEVKCIDNTIQLLFTNPADKTLTFVEDIVIHLNGMIVADPDCYRYAISPGKRVFCNDISGHLPIRKGKENLLQLSMGLEKFDFVIDCGE